MDLIIFTALNDEDIAEELIQNLLELNLIRSGSIFPKVKTMYYWEKQLTIDEEYKIMLKTEEKNYQKIEEFIKENHPYMAPEIIKFNVEFGSEEYKNFLKEKKNI